MNSNMVNNNMYEVFSYFKLNKSNHLTLKSESFNWFRWVIPYMISSIPDDERYSRIKAVLFYIQQRHSLNKDYKFSILEFAVDPDTVEGDCLFRLIDEKFYDFCPTFHTKTKSDKDMIYRMFIQANQYLSEPYYDNPTRFDIFDEPPQRQSKKKKIHKHKPTTVY